MKNEKLNLKDEHKQNTIQMTEIYLENILRHSSENIYWMSAEGRILGCNDNQAKFFGFDKAADVIGKDVYEICELLGLDRSMADAIHANDLEVMQTRQSKKIEESLIIDGKKRTYLSFKNPLLDNSNNVIGIFGVSVDISERKEMEEALFEAKEAAEVANRAKSDFLAVISHELRIPLTAILGMARLINGDEDLIHDEHKEPLKDLIKSGEHLLALVNSLLDLAKLEAGKLELQLATIDLKLLIEEITTVLSYQAKIKGLELIVDYDSSVPQQVIADAKALRQILLNLIGNAIKFTHQGRVIVKINCIAQTETQMQLTFIIEDTGIGIAADKQALIFEKFNQADGTRSRRYGGTGLGLSISKAYVEVMGGTIQVKSEIGKGSQFICLIPLAIPEQAIKQSPWENYCSNVKILLAAEDIHGEILYKYIGSPLTEIVKGNEVLNSLRAAQLQHMPFDIVIIDNHLKTEDSTQLAGAIKQHTKLQQPMLLLLTNTSTVPIKNAAQSAGYFDILIQSNHPTDLLISLTVAWEKWLERKKSSNDMPTALPPVAISQPKILLIEYPHLIQKVHAMTLEKGGYWIEVANSGKEAIAKLTQDYAAIFIDSQLTDIASYELIVEIRRREMGRKYIPIIGLIERMDEENMDSCWLAGMDDCIIKNHQPKALIEILQRWVVR